MKYSGKTPAVSRGPFCLTNDLVAGFWLIKAKSLDEAIDWMKRAPFDGGAEIEIRQVVRAEDFGEALTPELREQEERLRAQAGKNDVHRHSGAPQANPESRDCARDSGFALARPGMTPINKEPPPCDS